MSGGAAAGAAGRGKRWHAQRVPQFDGGCEAEHLEEEVEGGDEEGEGAVRVLDLVLLRGDLARLCLDLLCGVVGGARRAGCGGDAEVASPLPLVRADVRLALHGDHPEEEGSQPQPRRVNAASGRLALQAGRKGGESAGSDIPQPPLGRRPEECRGHRYPPITH